MSALQYTLKYSSMSIMSVLEYTQNNADASHFPARKLWHSSCAPPPPLSYPLLPPSLRFQSKMQPPPPPPTPLQAAICLQLRGNESGLPSPASLCEAFSTFLSTCTSRFRYSPHYSQRLQRQAVCHCPNSFSFSLLSRISSDVSHISYFLYFHIFLLLEIFCHDWNFSTHKKMEMFKNVFFCASSEFRWIFVIFLYLIRLLCFLLFLSFFLSFHRYMMVCNGGIFKWENV